MRNSLLVAALVLAVIGGYWWSTGERAQEQSTAPSGPAAQVADGDPDDPVLVIEVAGEATGVIELQLFSKVAPGHVQRITALAEDGSYDGVVFHRVIEGFMAQTGDVKYGKAGGDTSFAGSGGSALPDLPAEISDLPFERGVVGMARSSSPNSANSQFFIMFAPATHLNGLYTVVGQVVSGIEILDAIKRGDGPNGAVLGVPDRMERVTVRR